MEVNLHSNLKPGEMMQIDLSTQYYGSSFDLTSATLGAGVGLLAGYAVVKFLRGKNDDGYCRA